MTAEEEKPHQWFPLPRTVLDLGLSTAPCCGRRSPAEPTSRSLPFRSALTRPVSNLTGLNHAGTDRRTPDLNIKVSERRGCEQQNNPASCTVNIYTQFVSLTWRGVFFMILAEAGGSDAKRNFVHPCCLLQKLQRAARVIIRSNRGRHFLRLAKSLMKGDKLDSDKNRRK